MTLKIRVSPGELDLAVDVSGASVCMRVCVYVCMCVCEHVYMCVCVYVVFLQALSLCCSVLCSTLTIVLQ